ncbi:MAG: hypothetical protein HF312_20520 [Ignavibacteria bacterium]|jgi:hypothetical protein|nr:hypothetical protein [Ignavibacteria bacterium]MCU7522610.1 hypothetical protein [Ignavibacteria bacterium]HEX2961707.1 hypothetical protein [Ignavibacteriales bacterium]
MKNKRLHIAVSALILAVFTFHFLHSELDLVTSQYDVNHAAHDFCHLVDNTTTFNEHSGSQTLKKFIAHTSFNAVLTFVLLPVNLFVPESTVTLPPERPQEKPSYILNRILLI